MQSASAIAEPPASDSFKERFKRWFGTPSFWVVAMVVLWSYPLLSTALTPMPQELPYLGKVPAFDLTDQHGRPFRSSEQLEGRVWIANFIFTRCPTVCPKFSETMATLQHRSRHAAEGIHLVSFSVDPEYDTPEVLKEYAARFRASPRIWSFVTGPLDILEPVVVDGLKSAMGNEAPDGNIGGIFHGSHFVLVGPTMQIRGFYHADDEVAVDQLMEDANQLINRPIS